MDSDCSGQLEEMSPGRNGQGLSLVADSSLRGWKRESPFGG